MSKSLGLSKIVLAGLIVAVMSCGASWSEAGFVTLPRIVHSSGPRTQNANTSVFQPADLPQIVTVEVFMGDMWNVVGYWIDIDCANLSNGVGADLRLADVLCSVDADCEAAFGVPGSTCVDNQCQAIFLDTNRANFIFDPPCQSAAAISDTSCAPSMGVGDTSAMGCYDQNAAYVGSFAMEIDADAAGTFVIERSPASTMTIVNTQSGQFTTFPLGEIETTNGPVQLRITIEARIPPNPLANPDSEAAEAARSVGLVFAPRTAVVEPFAVRVTLDSLHHPNPPYAGGPVADFSSFEGQHRWLGPPVQYVESAANPSTFWASTLQCTPHYMDWSTVGPIHIVGSEVVPSSTLSVRTFGLNCMNLETTCTNVSAPLEISTARWGDVQIPFAVPGGPTQPDLGDAAALVDKFKNQPAALSKVRTKLQPATPNMAADVDFSDISICIDAFKGKPYPFTMQSCP